MDYLKKITELENEADQFGFRWQNTDQIMEQIQSECVEINEHLNDGLEHANQLELQEEIGDLLHAVFSLCVFCKLDPEDTLEKTVIKFERRLKAVKKITQDRGISNLNDHSFDELMRIWREAKQLVG